MDTPADSPPAPGVTRASLRPKPAAKASPDDEEMEVARPAAGLRNARAASSGPEVGAVQESPNSPKGPATEGELHSQLFCACHLGADFSSPDVQASHDSAREALHQMVCA